MLTAALERAGFDPAESSRRAALFAALDPVLGGAEPIRRWHVPGRIEVLGKHTDYAGGRSLVCATEQGIALAMAPRPDALVRIVDAGGREVREFELRSDAVAERGDWANYPVTIGSRLVRDFGPLSGVEIAFTSDLPIAAGVSSSSALTIAVALALIHRNRLETTESYRRNCGTPERLAGYLGAAENGRPFGDFGGSGGVGTMGGSQDHAAIICARPDSLSQFRFDPVELEGSVSWPHDWTLVIAASGVVAEKAGAALASYNGLATATAELRDLVAPPGATLGSTILDHDPSEWLPRAWSAIAALPDPDRADFLRDRLVQLVAECRSIIPGVVVAIERRDLDLIGELVGASQRGAEIGLRNQIPETVELAGSAVPLGAIAGSAFGAGFGGSVWAMVLSERADRFVERWRSNYLERFPGRENARFIRTRPAVPAFEVRPDR